MRSRKFAISFAFHFTVNNIELAQMSWFSGSPENLMYSSSVQPKPPFQQLPSFSKCIAQSELLGSSQEDSEVKEQNPSGYWDSEQEVKASISSQGLKIYLHIDPYNCRYESKNKIFMGPKGCNF